MSARLAVRLLWAAALLVVPGRVLRMLDSTADTRGWRTLLRILGVRHVVQARLEWRGSHRAAVVGVAVDSVHAASAFTAAACVPRHRRMMLADGAFAATLASAGARASRR